MSTLSRPPHSSDRDASTATPSPHAGRRGWGRGVTSSRARLSSSAAIVTGFAPTKVEPQGERPGKGLLLVCRPCDGDRRARWLARCYRAGVREVGPDVAGSATPVAPPSDSHIARISSAVVGNSVRAAAGSAPPGGEVLRFRSRRAVLMEWLAEFGEWFALVAPGVRGDRRSCSTTSPTRASRDARLRAPSDASGCCGPSRSGSRGCRPSSVRWRHCRRRWIRPIWITLGTLRQLCTDLAARAAAERRAPGSTTIAQDIEALLDAAASLGNEYARSASLGHVLELYVEAGLLEQARSHARWVTDITVRDRLHQDPLLSPVLRREGPSLLLMRASAPAPAGGDAAAPSPEPKSAE